MKIEIGILVQDKISGFKGHSIARCVYFNGCIQHEVQAMADDDNKMQPNLWIDEEQLIDVTPKLKSPPNSSDSDSSYTDKSLSTSSGGGHRNHP